jgi:UTP--glucose-1-phosphate uridylyltransferase
MDNASARAAVAAAMQVDGQPREAIDAFLRTWDLVAAGASGTIAEAEIAPAGALPALRDGVDEAARAGRRAAGLAALPGLAIVKLSGGLGTSMGLQGPKALLEVRPGWTFLDLLARQVLALREAFAVTTPLVLMHSFATRRASLAHLARWPALAVDDLPLDFLQHRVPRLDAATLAPLDGWLADDRAWCPPGHGDLYPALSSSGLLAALRRRGVHTLFVSNIDNLGATVDLELLGLCRTLRAPLVMEVAARTAADRKGGHLCRRRRDGALILRESAQVAAADAAHAGDLERHQTFNTNSLWIDVEALHRALERHGGSLPLAPIVNRKRIDLGEAGGPRAVIQLETAMGAAIAALPGAQAVLVPRSRFLPVKTCADLLVLRSDRFERQDDGRLVATSAEPPPDVVLDGPYHTVPALEERFPHGPPGLRRCRRLLLRGDVRFGPGVTLEGEVEIAAEGDDPRWIMAT